MKNILWTFFVLSFFVLSSCDKEPYQYCDWVGNDYAGDGGVLKLRENGTLQFVAGSVNLESELYTSDDCINIKPHGISVIQVTPLAIQFNYRGKVYIYQKQN